MRYILDGKFEKSYFYTCKKCGAQSPSAPSQDIAKLYAKIRGFSGKGAASLCYDCTKTTNRTPSKR